MTPMARLPDSQTPPADIRSKFDTLISGFGLFNVRVGIQQRSFREGPPSRGKGHLHHHSHFAESTFAAGLEQKGQGSHSRRNRHRLQRQRSSGVCVMGGRVVGGCGECEVILAGWGCLVGQAGGGCVCGKTFDRNGRFGDR